MPVLTHKPSSSNIESIIYNSDRHLAAIRFHSGKTYVHTGITPEIFTNWSKDWSAGKYYNQIIRKNPTRYPIVAVK